MATAAARYIEGIGRRKSATARVRITPAAKNTIKVNSKSLSDYFNTQDLELEVGSALVPDLTQKYSISALVKGGGQSSQASAIKLGIARAVVKHNADMRPSVKKAGLLTREPRKVERKKFGKKKSRKSAQWSKR